MHEYDAERARRLSVTNVCLSCGVGVASVLALLYMLYLYSRVFTPAYIKHELLVNNTINYQRLVCEDPINRLSTDGVNNCNYSQVRSRERVGMLALLETLEYLSICRNNECSAFGLNFTNMTLGMIAWFSYALAFIALLSCTCGVIAFVARSRGRMQLPLTKMSARAA